MLFLAGFFFVYLGYYLNKVVKHRYGVREKCFYCLRPGRAGTKVAPTDVDTEEIDTMESVGVCEDACDLMCCT